MSISVMIIDIMSNSPITNVKNNEYASTNMRIGIRINKNIIMTKIIITSGLIELQHIFQD